MANRSNQFRTVAGIVSCVFIASALTTSSAYANDDEARADTIAACNEAARLLEANDIDGALEEADWCREGLQQMKQQQTLAVFPDAVDGYIGGEVSNEGALGMVILGREYTKGDKNIKLELTTGAVAGGLGNLSELINAFGAAGGSDGKKIRIQRRTVIDSSKGGTADLTVQLKSGGMMSVSSTSVSGDEAIEFLRAFPIAELDDAMSN